MCLASQNNHPTSLASSWDISFFKSLVQQDPTGSNKVAHLYILDVYVSPNRKYINLPLIYCILYFSFFMSRDDAYFHIHQNDPANTKEVLPVSIFLRYHQHAQWASTYQGSRVTITISITGWQLELGPARKLCSVSLELYNVVEIMCSRCDLCLEHNVQCPLIRFQAKLMCCFFPLRRRLCTLEEEKWVVSLKLKLCVVYIVCSWEVDRCVSVIVVVRVGKGTTTLHALTSWAGKNVDGSN